MEDWTIYKSGCWGCLRARESDGTYICPQSQQHQIEYQKLENEREQL